MSESIPQSTTEPTRSDDFQRAQLIAGKVTAMLTSFFSSAIRSIRLEYLRAAKKNWEPEKIWNTCGFLVGVSPTIKTALYHAAATFYPEQLAKLPELNPKSLASLFHPDDLASLIALVYVHRSLKKHFDPTSWRRIEEDAFTAMLISSAVGQTVHHMSRGDAMLQGGLRIFAQSALAFFGKELPPVEKGTVARGKAKQATPEQREIIKHGCSHLQVAAQIAQTLGFGSDIGLCIAAPATDKNSIPEYLKSRAAAWAATRTLTDSFQAFGHAPEVGEDSDLYLTTEENESLTALINKLLEEDLPKCWIGAKPEDLPISVRQSLGLEAKTPSASLEDEIPAEVAVPGEAKAK